MEEAQRVEKAAAVVAIEAQAEEALRGLFSLGPHVTPPYQDDDDDDELQVELTTKTTSCKQADNMLYYAIICRAEMEEAQRAEEAAAAAAAEAGAGAQAERAVANRGRVEWRHAEFLVKLDAKKVGGGRGRGGG
jgi:hypothetical protein